MSANNSESFRKFQWKKPQEIAAALLAEDELTDSEIAEKVGITPRQLWNWKKHPEFSARITELAREMGDAASRYAITRKTRRLNGYNDRRNRLLKVIEERAKEHAEATGGESGLLVKTTKSVGSGPAAEIIEEYAVDTGLLKELRELEKQAAIESGQWTEKREHTLPNIDDLINAELERIAGRGQGATSRTPADDTDPA